jgi:hypothetical protein
VREEGRAAVAASILKGDDSFAALAHEQDRRAVGRARRIAHGGRTGWRSQRGERREHCRRALAKAEFAIREIVSGRLREERVAREISRLGAEVGAEPLVHTPGPIHVGFGRKPV